MESLKSIRQAEVDNFFKQSFEQKKPIPLYVLWNYYAANSHAATPVVSDFFFFTSNQILMFTTAKQEKEENKRMPR